MFRKKDHSTKTEFDTVIGAGTEFKGNLKVQGPLQIDGTVEGDITSNQNIIIGQDGTVYADITSENITINGEVHGNIECSNNLEILSTGKLYGDIQVGNLFVEDGAIFDGNCVMKEKTEENNASQPEIREAQ